MRKTVLLILLAVLIPAAAQSQPPVPLGVNIEEVSAHNFDLAVQMAREFPSWRGGEGAPAIPGPAPVARGPRRERGP